MGLTIAGRPAAAGSELALILACGLAPAALGHSAYEQAPINYFTAPHDDPVARLAARIEHGEVRPEADRRTGYLPSLLKHLDSTPLKTLARIVFMAGSFSR